MCNRCLASAVGDSVKACMWCNRNRWHKLACGTITTKFVTNRHAFGQIKLEMLLRQFCVGRSMWTQQRNRWAGNSKAHNELLGICNLYIFSSAFRTCKPKPSLFQAQTVLIVIPYWQHFQYGTVPYCRTVCPRLITSLFSLLTVFCEKYASKE